MIRLNNVYYYSIFIANGHPWKFYINNMQQTYSVTYDCYYHNFINNTISKTSDTKKNIYNFFSNLTSKYKFNFKHKFYDEKFGIYSHHF